jgi:hypothetical protein
MNLGIIWKDGKVTNHRSLLKVLLNPILRCFGWQIGSEFDNNQFICLRLIPAYAACSNCRPMQWAFRYPIQGCVVEKKRRII